MLQNVSIRAYRYNTKTKMLHNIVYDFIIYACKVLYYKLGPIDNFDMK